MPGTYLLYMYSLYTSLECQIKKKIIMQEYFFSLQYHTIFDADNIHKI